MFGVLVADKDMETRKQIAMLLIDAGYDVIVTKSAVDVIRNVLNENVQILLLGMELNEIEAIELMPLLKKCKRKLSVILVADDPPLPVIRSVRKDGIFYHALRPSGNQGIEEIKQVVKCAGERLYMMGEHGRGLYIQRNRLEDCSLEKK